MQRHFLRVSMAARNVTASTYAPSTGAFEPVHARTGPTFALSSSVGATTSTTMDNLTPSDLFSPSKARQQRAQAQDWAHIDSWLSYKYAGRTVPTFERNDETLKVLRELSMANERADDERTVMERLEREALKELDEV